MQSKAVRRRAWPALTLATLALCAWSPASAQTAPAAIPAAPEAEKKENAKDDDVLNLEEFVVTASKVNGYRATNSITATGIGTDIGSTPITINVVTKDLIGDTRSDLINDTLRYVPGVVTAPTNESQPAVRGFTGTYSLRNGVFRRQNLTTWNVDRVEVIQGSSSIFYSNIRPGGVINYITTKPVIGQTFADVSLAGGDNAYYRAEGAFNVAMGDKLALRFVVGKLSNDTYRRDFNETQEFFSAAAVWNITPNQQLTLEAGVEDTWRRNSWTSYAVLLTNSHYWNNAAAIASGQTLAQFMTANFPGQPLYDMFAPFKPRPDDPYGRTSPIIVNTYQHAQDRPVDLTYNAKLTDNLFLSVVGNYAYEDNQGINPVWSGDITADGTLRSYGAQKFINIRDSWNANVKLTYRTRTGGIKHTLMVGYDNQWVTQRYPQVNGTANQNSPTGNFNPQTQGAPDGAFLVASSPVPFNSVRKNVQYFGGTYLVDQMSMFDDKLFVVIGDRYVDFTQEVTYSGKYGNNSTTTLPTPPPDAVAKKWTPQIGALYKFNGGISVFGSYSESIIPQTQIDASGQTVLPIDGKGYDVGFKVDLLDGALTGTVDYYEITQENTAIPDAAKNIANGLPANATFGYYTYGNAQKVRGAQVDLNYNVTKDTQLVASWNHFLQAEFVSPQSNPLMLGVPIFYQPEDMVSLWAKYQPVDGALKGFILGGGLRYNSETILGGSFDNSRFIIPDFTVADLLVGYRTKLYDRPIEFRLNVKNVFDKEYRDGLAFGDARWFILSATTRF